MKIPQVSTPVKKFNLWDVAYKALQNYLTTEDMLYKEQMRNEFILNAGKANLRNEPCLSKEGESAKETYLDWLEEFRDTLEQELDH